MSKYGVFAADGSIEQEADECAVCGAEVLGNHAVMYNVGQRHFVRILSHKEHLITDAMRQQWVSDCAEPTDAAAPVEPVAPVVEGTKSFSPRRGKNKDDEPVSGESE